MLRKLLLVALGSAMIFATAPAWAIGMSLVGVGNNTTLKTDNNSTSWSANGIGLGGGALLDFHTGMMTGFELGGLYMHRKVTANFTTSSGTLVVDNDATAVEVPLLFRLWFSRAVSIGLGGYYLHYLKVDASEYYQSSPGTVTNTSSTLSSDDYGATGSLAFNIPLSFTTSVLVDARYNYGLKKSQRIGEAQGLVGLSFGL